MRRWLFENFGLKVLALFISAALWAYVGSRQVLERRVVLRLEIGDIPAGMKVDSSVKTAIPVVLSGRKDSVLDLDPEELKAVISLSNYQPGKKEMSVHPTIQPLPPGVTATVQNITLHLEPLADPAKSTKLKRKS